MPSFMKMEGWLRVETSSQGEDPAPWGIIPRPWDIIKELKTFSHLDFRIAIDQWPLCAWTSNSSVPSLFLPLEQKTARAAVYACPTTVMLGVWGANTVPLVSRVCRGRKTELTELYLMNDAENIHAHLT